MVLWRPHNYTFINTFVCFTMLSSHSVITPLLSNQMQILMKFISSSIHIMNTCGLKSLILSNLYQNNLNNIIFETEYGIYV